MSSFSLPPILLCYCCVPLAPKGWNHHQMGGSIGADTPSLMPRGRELDMAVK